MDVSVSVITPVHNSERYLRECVNSVLAQTYQNWELILADDNSTDSSKKIIQEFAALDPRIKYIELSENSGAGLARNKALEMAKGRFISFLDSDDIWYPRKLSAQLDFMTKNDHKFTFTSYRKMNRDGKKTKTIVKAKKVVTYARALYKNPIGCLTVIYDTDYFGKQYMPPNRKRQDFALWLRLLKQTDAYGLDECLACYRVRYNSISFNKLMLIKHEWKIYRHEEKLSVPRSLFYLLSAIILKMKSYF